MKFKNLLLLFCCVFTCSLILSSCGDEEDPEPEPEVTSYADDIAPLITSNCENCHTGDMPTSTVSLDTYDDLKAYGESGVLVERINDEMAPMPPSGLLDTETRQKIADWIDEGYPE